MSSFYVQYCNVNWFHFSKCIMCTCIMYLFSFPSLLRAFPAKKECGVLSKHFILTIFLGSVNLNGHLQTLQKLADAIYRFFFFFFFFFFSEEKLENFIRKISIFLIFLLKTYAVGSTHNLCFGTKIRKIGILYPCKPQFYHIKVGYKQGNFKAVIYKKGPI